MTVPHLLLPPPRVVLNVLPKYALEIREEGLYTEWKLHRLWLEEPGFVPILHWIAVPLTKPLNVSEYHFLIWETAMVILPYGGLRQGLKSALLLNKHYFIVLSFFLSLNENGQTSHESFLTHNTLNLLCDSFFCAKTLVDPVKKPPSQEG